MDNFEILQKLKEENARLAAEIKAIKNGDTLDNIEIIHPEYDEEITACGGSSRQPSLMFVRCFSIIFSICIIFGLLSLA